MAHLLGGPWLDFRLATDYRRADSSHRSQAPFFMGHFALHPLLNGSSPIGCFYRCVVA